MHPIQKQNHLLWRAGFGPTPEMLSPSTSFQAETFVKAMLNEARQQPVPFTIAEKWMEEMGTGTMSGATRQQMAADSDNAAERRKQLQQLNRKATRSLNIAWLNEMVSSPAQLREKMAFFWHGHFACRSLNSNFQQQLINTIREYALSDFGTLLKAVSKSPAMLQFLNNQQNRKNNPNENFAREVMELFTLGRGNYTEKDIKEAARAFTGWGFNADGAFQFRSFQHDSGEKTVLGKKGNFTGDDILNIILEERQTSIFICEKIYRFFVNDNVNMHHVDWLAKRFYDSGYQMIPLLTDIFTSDWFYANPNIGTRIKSPIEFIAGIRRQLPMKLEKDEGQLLLQRALGQVLFYPPNVAGWPGGKSWIDSSSLLLRMKIPQLFASNDGIEIHIKSDDDTEMGQAEKNAGAMNRYMIKAQIDWDKALSPFSKLNDNNRYEMISAGLLQTKHLPAQNFLEKLLDDPKDTARLIITLMSMPEYQLC